LLIFIQNYQVERKEFLALIGMSAGAFALSRCLGGCKAAAQPYPTPPTNVNITLNLSDAANKALNTQGGYIYTGGIIVARTLNPSPLWVAVSQYCTHLGTSVVFQTTNNDFYCSEKGAVFGYTGAVVTGPATVPLQQYSVAYSPNTYGGTLVITG
jgi:cytochrome b6-f complex iron-sulfur subunit